MIKSLKGVVLVGLALILTVFVLSTDARGEQNRRVMAFYYPWYGTADGPGGAGRTVHWGRIHAASQDISDSTHYPLDGAYDSHSPQVIERHCRQARAAGIDTLIVSWWGKDSYEDRTLPQILDFCGRYGLNVTVYYESVPQPQTAATAAEDILEHLLKRYTSHPAWLRSDGKPVVFVYGRAIEEIGLLGWHQVKQRVERAFPGGVVLMGDGLSYGAAAVFDGIHTYNPAGDLADKSPAQVRTWCAGAYPLWIQTAHRQGKIAALTVIPGYDDTKIRTPGLKVERFEGGLYAAQWEQALQTQAEWILITSFNEWHEGSEIEPSVEYGDAYLKMTSRWAGRFQKANPPEQTPPAAFSTSVEKQIQDVLAGRTMAVLPAPDSTAFWWLLKYRPDLKVLSWEEALEGGLSPQRYSMVLYAAGETYQTTKNEEGDIRRALESYVRARGVLVVLPSQPWPFYYDERGQVVNDAARFGISLGGGWEQPPAGTELFFEPVGDPLVLSGTIPFPGYGDLRWRPFKPGPQQIGYVPLLVLKDRGGKVYGDGLVIAQIAGGGKVAYGWFGLLNTPHAESVLAELFLRLAGP